MSLRSVILATATLCAYVTDAHMKMATPVPFSVDKLDNGPIASKQQWPCKRDIGYTITKMNAMAVGEQQTLTFDGTAVHGGGSCQLAVTMDTEPTENSKFKVIQSIEGGCPGIEGKVEKYPFALPDSIPNGKATFAWTWFAKLSGGPEMYMNCAPIEVTGGASDTTAFDALPDLFVANIAEVTDCKSQPSQALLFPAPGSDVVMGSTDDQKPPQGSCAAAGTSPADPSAPAGSGTPASSAAGGQPSAAPTSAGGNDGMYTPPAGAGATSAAAVPTSAAAVPTSAAGGASGAVPTSQAAATSAPASSAPGGVFAPGASSAAPVASTQTTLVTVTGTPSTPSKTTAAASKPATTTAAAGTGSSGAAPTSAPVAGGAGGEGTCTTDGAVVCNGANQFGLCNGGKVVWQAVAAGTTCSNGTITKRGYHGRIVRRGRGFVGHVHKH